MELNKYKDSNGDKWDKNAIDRKVSDATSKKIDQFFDEHSYIFCEDCGRSSGVVFDCSHEVSVDECQKDGHCEDAWSIDNIKIRCRACHQKHDKL